MDMTHVTSQTRLVWANTLIITPSKGCVEQRFILGDPSPALFYFHVTAM